jgi:sigma-B regulation protein RsbU (phosphoserine phosphatase)
VIRALVVDDEAPARARLRALLDDIGGVTVVGEAGDADAARAAVATLEPDVVFLDIEMPAERGTALAATLPEPRPFIVFATAYERFAIDAFQYDAADYLLKPVNRQRLQATLDRMRGKLADRRAAEREVAAAVRAQAHLLPQSLPAAPGYELTAQTLAARAVGGDFYDAVPAGDQLAFVLGDVAGKGLAAGLVASSVQARWQAAMQQRDLTLAGMMAALNRDVYRSTEGSRYATLVHGVLTPATGHLRYVNAGHPPSLVVGSDGSWRPALEATAPAIGLFDGATFPAGGLELGRGDTLIVMSDGVCEALDAEGRELDLGGLAAIVAACVGRGANVATAVVDAVRAHRGAHQTQDDVTVLSLQRTA